MKMENEITVLVNCSFNELHEELIKNNFQIKEKYQLNDIYMIDKNVDIKAMEKLEVLKKCILVREIGENTKKLVYKYKKYALNGDILEQGKVECPITDIDKAVSFMESINYRELLKIYDEIIVYANDKTELAVQLVNNEYIFIEVEDKCNYIDRVYTSIEEMKEDLDSYNLPYNKDNYFVKKAELMLEDVLNN